MCLTTIPGKYGSDYINASFIDVRKLVAIKLYHILDI